MENQNEKQVMSAPEQHDVDEPQEVIPASGEPAISASSEKKSPWKLIVPIVLVVLVVVLIVILAV